MDATLPAGRWDYTLNKQKQTDDYPYGGGCGIGMGVTRR